MVRKSLFALIALAAVGFGAAGTAQADPGCHRGGYYGGYHRAYYGGYGGYYGGPGYGYPRTVVRSYYGPGYAPYYGPRYGYPRAGYYGGSGISFSIGF